MQVQIQTILSEWGAVSVGMTVQPTLHLINCSYICINIGIFWIEIMIGKRYYSLAQAYKLDMIDSKTFREGRCLVM